MQTVTQSFMTCTAGYMFLQSSFEFKFSLALLWLLSEISFVISGTRHEKLVSIDRFLFSFPILCDLVVTLLYSADLCIWFQWIVVHVIKEVYSSAHLKFSLLPLSSSEHWVPTSFKVFHGIERSWDVGWGETYVASTSSKGDIVERRSSHRNHSSCCTIRNCGFIGM